MIVPNVFCNPLSNKANILKRDWSNFDQENFILDYFSIGVKYIKYSHKHFSDYLNDHCKNSIFIQLTDSEEIANIISTLNMNKFSGPN